MNKGRPRLDNSKSSQYRLRLTYDELEYLKWYSSEHKKPISQIIREALKLYFEKE